jgi:hypothetical protein
MVPVQGLVAALLLTGCSFGSSEDPADLSAHLQSTLPHDSSIDPARIEIRIEDGDVSLQVDATLTGADAEVLCRDVADWLYKGHPENTDNDIIVTDGEGRLLALSLAERTGCGPPPQ